MHPVLACWKEGAPHAQRHCRPTQAASLHRLRTPAYRGPRRVGGRCHHGGAAGAPVCGPVRARTHVAAAAARPQTQQRAARAAAPPRPSACGGPAPAPAGTSAERRRDDAPPPPPRGARPFARLPPPTPADSVQGAGVCPLASRAWPTPITCNRLLQCLRRSRAGSDDGGGGGGPASRRGRQDWCTALTVSCCMQNGRVSSILKALERFRNKVC